MLKVRILVGLAGSPFQPGEEPTLPDDVARQMVGEGRAELVGGSAVRERSRQPRGARTDSQVNAPTTAATASGRGRP